MLHPISRSLILIVPLSAAGAAVADEDKTPVVRNPTLGAGLAMTLARTAYDECTEMGHRVAVAVVARDGGLVAFMRNPDAGPHTIDVAEGKAWTANTFRTGTSALQASSGRDFMKTIPGALVIGGGVPINLGGFHLGAVGVSGAPADKHPGDVDDRCAEAGIEEISADVEMAD